MSKLRLLTVIAACALVGAVAGCANSSDSSTSTTTTAPATTAPTTTAAPTTTEPPEATGRAPSSDAAAAQLVDAWNERNRDAAAVIGDPLAVDGIFATPDDEMWLRGCTTDDSLPEGGCIYRTATGLVQINTELRGDGWVVSSAVYDPLEAGNEVSGDAPNGPSPDGPQP